MFTGIQLSSWVYPVLEIIHIIGVALLLGNLVLVELRIFGLGAALPVDALARLSLPLAATGFSLAVLSGSLMFATQPADLLNNRAFLAKMLLLLVAGSNAAIFHARQSLEKLDAMARVQMVISTVIWVAAIASGRWIAYI